MPPSLRQPSRSPRRTASAPFLCRPGPNAAAVFFRQVSFVPSGLVIRPMGRTRSFDEDVALERAMRLFWQQGYEGTSLEDLTSTLGIAKPSLYAAFGNKRSLFTKAMDRYTREGARGLPTRSTSPGPRTSSVASFASTPRSAPTCRQGASSSRGPWPAVPSSRNSSGRSRSGARKRKPCSRSDWPGRRRKESCWRMRGRTTLRGMYSPLPRGLPCRPLAAPPPRSYGVWPSLRS